MLLIVLGNIGLGLVWGWLIGSISGSMLRPILTSLALTLATLVFIGLLFVLVGKNALIPFLGAVAVAFILRLGWRQHLYGRFGSHR